MTQILPYVLEVGTQEVVLTPDPTHEFTATTEQVALGYGVTPENIRKHKETKAEELVEGKHFLSVSNTHAGNLTQTLWTKRGIVRLGFFIRSARARLFRDIAEDLVIGVMTAPQAGTPALISARLIGQATGQSNRECTSFVQRRGLRPVAHFFEPRCRAPSYLYVLTDVERVYAERGYPHRPFVPFEGEAFPGVAPVLSAVTKQMQTKASNANQPRLIPATPAPVTDRVQAAQELVQLEQRRAHLLSVLA